MKLTEKSNEVFECVKNNGGRVAVSEISAIVGRPERSINANVNDLTKKGLVVREKEAAQEEGAKDITYVCLTDEGHEFVPTED